MVAYCPWVVYTMGKCALILKGGTCCSVVLVAAMQGSYHTCSCYEGCISICTMYHSIWYSTMGYHSGLKGMCVSL